MRKIQKNFLVSPKKNLFSLSQKKFSGFQKKRKKSFGFPKNYIFLVLNFFIFLKFKLFFKNKNKFLFFYFLAKKRNSMSTSSSSPIITKKRKKEESSTITSKKRKKGDTSLLSSDLEIGFHPSQCKMLNVIFDTCRDFTRHEVIKFHSKYGLWSQIRDPGEKLCCDFFISPSSLWRYHFKKEEEEEEEEKEGEKEEKKEEEKKGEEQKEYVLLLNFVTIYTKLKLINKTNGVWSLFFLPNLEHSLPQWEFHPYDPRSHPPKRMKSRIYRPPKNWSNIITSQRLGQDVQVVTPNSYTHAIWISSCELTNALNKIDLMDDSRMTVSIRGNCLLLFAYQHGQEIDHLHGTIGKQDEWLTPYEKDYFSLSTKEENTLTNLPALNVVCSLKANFCNKVANNSSDRVLIVLSATNSKQDILFYFPIRAMKEECFVRFRFAPPAPSTHHHLSPPTYIPPEYYNCELTP